MFVLFFPLIILTISYLSIFIFISYFSHLYYTLVDKKEKKNRHCLLAMNVRQYVYIFLRQRFQFSSYEKY